MKHKLKTWTPFFNDVIERRKLFELRLNDRGFQVGDVLVLQEWNSDTHEYTGREFDVVVTYLTDGTVFGALAKGWVCMSIDPDHLRLSQSS